MLHCILKWFVYRNNEHRQPRSSNTAIVLVRRWYFTCHAPTFLKHLRPSPPFSHSSSTSSAYRWGDFIWCFMEAFDFLEAFDLRWHSKCRSPFIGYPDLKDSSCKIYKTAFYYISFYLSVALGVGSHECFQQDKCCSLGRETQGQWEHRDRRWDLRVHFNLMKDPVLELAGDQNLGIQLMTLGHDSDLAEG